MNRETIRNPEPPEIVNPTFVLLLGPSGVGKNSLIRELQKKDGRFKFVPPITDRPLREGETEKVSISIDAFSELEQRNFFLLVNQVYGNRYGTPRETINNILEENNIPILDFPISEVPKLGEYDELLYKVYVTPPTLGTLKSRLDIDGRAQGNDRYEESRRELLELVHLKFQHPHIDQVLINNDIAQASNLLLDMIYQRISL